MVEDQFYQRPPRKDPEPVKNVCKVYGDHHEYIEYKRKLLERYTQEHMLYDEEWTTEHEIYRIWYRCDCGAKISRDE